jgi:hypothetical protein
MYSRYRRDETIIMYFDIEGLSPLISNNVTFDVDPRCWRCKTSISIGRSISKSSISNVTLHIEGPTLDIGLARIQMSHGWILDMSRLPMIMISESGLICPDIRISWYRTRLGDIGTFFHGTRYRVIPDIGYFPISGIGYPIVWAFPRHIASQMLSLWYT